MCLSRYLRYGSHGLLAIILIVGAAAAWQMLQALDSKTDALTRHFRVDVWTTQEAELEGYQLRHALARYVAKDEGVTIASIRDHLTRLRQAIALLAVKDRTKEQDAVPGGEELVAGFGDALDRLETLIAGRADIRGDVALLGRADVILMPWLDQLRQLASSLTHIRLELQDRDSAKVDQLIQLNRWLLLTVVGAAILFIGLLVMELRIARRAEAEARSDQRRFQDYAEIASDWMFETDAQLDLRFVSEQVEASTGLSATHYLGGPAHRLFADPKLNERQSPIIAAIRDRRPFRDVTVSLNDNQLFLRLSGKPVLSEAGQFLGFRGIGTDISSEVKRKERIRFATMTLDGMETMLHQHFGKKGSGKAAKNKVNLIKYADDFVVTGTTRNVLEEAKALIEAFLNKRGLSLSAEKTRIVHIDDGFDFLGWTLRKYDGKLLVKPAKKNVQAHSRKVRATIKEMRTAKQEEVIAKLNPIIRGWANYHQNQVAKETFNKVDSLTWKRLWRWACRRHPSKSKTWIKNRYFLHVGTRSWVFGTKDKGDDGKVRFVKLVQASDTPIRRHTKIKGAANPFDPAWEPYFEKRLGLTMKESLGGKQRLLCLWRAQKGVCPNCHEPITKNTGWHIHHILPKVQGGTDNLTNLMLLHPNCHRQIHNLERRELAAPVKRGFAEA